MYRSQAWSNSALTLLALLLTQCKQADSQSAVAESLENQSVQAIEDNAQAIEIVDYPKLYCENVDKLQLRALVKDELSYFCKNGKPTPDLLKSRSKALTDEPGKFQLVLLQAEHDSENDQSEFLIAWSFHVPIRPFEVKARPIYDYVASGFSSDVIDLKAQASRRLDDPLDSGLHLWSTDMSYDLTVKGTQGLTLASQRKTQYNLYQVQSGNEEMGFGVEHLTDVDNPNFLKSTMLNLSFNDGRGFNDGKGGAVVVTLLHFVLSNQGFPATATKSIQEIAQHTADGMYNGLKE